MSKASDRLGPTLPLHIEFGSGAVQVIDSLSVEAAYILLADNPECRQQTGRFSREQAAEIANAIMQALTDESRLYGEAKGHFAEHSTVRHSAGEYARGEVHTNTIEGYFSIFKRGIKGVYQHCAEKHLHRYLAEFDFRYNHWVKLGFTDMERTIAAVRGAEGKRLTLHQTQ